MQRPDYTAFVFMKTPKENDGYMVLSYIVIISAVLVFLVFTAGTGTGDLEKHIDSWQAYEQNYYSAQTCEYALSLKKTRDPSGNYSCE